MRSVFSEKPCYNCNADRQIGNPYNWQRECDRCTKIGQWRNEVLKRLAEIENILGDEYDLDRLKELVEADKGGRCLVLPCKEGKKVYKIDFHLFEGCPPEIYESVFHVTDYYGIGNTVFFTKEEAEKALEGLE